jgi:predicted Zn-dependent peptidase
MMQGVSTEAANDAINNVLQSLIEKSVSDRELTKVQNKFESNLVMGQTNCLNKAMALSYYEMLGDASLLNREIEKYLHIKPIDIKHVASEVFCETNCSTLYYLAEK